MLIADKRKVIEVLLSVAGPGGSIIWHVRGYQPRILRAAFLEWFNSDESGGYDLNCLEAVYRLIESSPTLRREWFARC